MTVFEKQYYSTKNLICRKDKTLVKLRCPGCEILKRYTKYSRSFQCPQTLWRHICQCTSFSLISHLKRKDAVVALEEICQAIRNNTSLEMTTGRQLGMVV